jgi:antitoxin MazE
MQVQVARWGNSLGVRIPKQIAERAGIREGARVDIEAEAERIVITRARPRYRLAELLRGMTPEAVREAFDWGRDRGREIVEWHDPCFHARIHCFRSEIVIASCASRDEAISIRGGLSGPRLLPPERPQGGHPGVALTV